MGNKGRWEYLRAIYERYQQAGRKDKKTILSEFCANAGYNRKYAIRLLNRDVAQLEKRRKRLDPFQLAGTIERKLVRIYRLANRRLSPKEVQETASSRRGKGCGKDARSASLEIKKRFPLSHNHGREGESTVTFQMSRRPSLELHS